MARRNHGGQPGGVVESKGQQQVSQLVGGMFQKNTRQRQGLQTNGQTVTEEQVQ